MDIHTYVHIYLHSYIHTYVWTPALLLWLKLKRKDLFDLFLDFKSHIQDQIEKNMSSILLFMKLHLSPDNYLYSNSGRQKWLYMCFTSVLHCVFIYTYIYDSLIDYSLAFQSLASKICSQQAGGRVFFKKASSGIRATMN